MRILMRFQFPAPAIRACFFLLLFNFIYVLEMEAQWLEWQDITSTNLVLSSVANSDDEEKDISSGDLNNDGFMDVIVVRKEPFSASSEPPKSDLLLINENGILVDRTNEFAPEFISNPSFARDVLIYDLDGDGWEDVVVANTFNQQPFYYRNLGNDGNGNWLGLVDESAARFPTMSDGATLICAVWAGDVTGDGFEDVYFVNYAQSGTAKDYLFINDGNGFFTDESEARLGDLRNSAFGTAVEIFDMDNDGDNDIIKTSVLFQTAPWNTQGLFLLYNDGTGNFNNWQKISPTNASYMFRIEDINQDGKLDVYVVDDATDYQLIASSITPNSNINYTSTNINSNRITGFGGNVHSADLDIDGDMEFAIADVDVDIPPCNSARTFAVMQNDNGNIIDPYTSTGHPWEGNSYDFCFLDVNNDGLQDMFIGRCEGYDLLLNDNCELASGGADFDLDGITDACDECPTNPDPNCIEDPEFPTVDPNLNIARKWNEMLLESIRKDFARPTVHARNLFHSSVAMWDSWASYNTPACHYLLGNTVEGFECDFSDFTSTLPDEESTEATLSYAMYRLLSYRFQSSPEGNLLQEGYDNLMNELGYDVNINSMDYSDGDPIKLGNYIADCIINYGLQDGSNEQNAYANTAYLPVNDPLIIDNPGNPSISDYNRWQPLTLDLFIDQSGNIIPGSTPDFLSPEWGAVASFALNDNDLNVYQRDGFDYNVFHDPGAPPNTDLSGGAETDDYLYGVAMVGIWSSHLDPTDNVMWDISPGNLGNSAAFPTNFSDYPNFYDQLEGGTAANGHPVNPVTGQAYAPNMVPRGDFARVLAEFWADGPDSETPPGHWFSILNYVADHPDFEKRFEGQGDILPETEWYVKSYFGMGGAMHDAAVSAWGIKGWYDYIRPISALRAAADLGQSTDTQAANYHPAGLPLITDQFETIEAGDPLAGAANEHVDKIKMKAWLGHDAINNVDSDVAGVDWIRVEDWVPYQRPSFVTPPFAGYVSGHSTFSRAAAEYLTKITGDAYFPGGMGTFTATQNEFLVFEDGPSMDIELQWATYHDAADQSGLSRIWGGIHPPADDIPGRIIGEQIGLDAFSKLKTYFMDNDEDGVCDPDDICAGFDDNLIGTPCDDGDACTTGETYDSNCACSGGTPVGDSDGDGVCDAEDVCPNFDDNLIGMACDDGDACTTGETYDANCGCSGGTPVGDSDGDGVCDAEDVCPNFDDNLIGTACDDGDICTTGETYDANCGCSGGTPVGDSDGDGVCDAEDVCPNFDDNLIGTACDDGDVCTTGETYDANCGCSGGTEIGDSDGDGVCDAEDVCPNFDDNLIGTACDDGDICTEGETYDSNCGCSGGTPVGDSDGDGVCDVEDVCPNFDDNLIGTACDDGDACTTGETYDSNCGCSGGTPVGDSDGDGVCDTEDVCPNFDDNLIGTACDDGDICTTGETYDANCGCSGGTPVGDSDGDGVCDAEDVCPNFDDNLIGMACDDGDACTTGETYDANCGCSGGTEIGDSDGDGVCDAEDVCPNFNDNLIGTACDDGDICTTGETYDSNCGCSGGIPVGDSDGDGVCDTEDACPNFDDNLIGTACDDGDACTTGEAYDANCGCSGGTPEGDSDGDGVCDTEDVCPNFDDNLIGTPCDDGDICTTDETYDSNCGCSGGTPVGDSDGDGVCDAEDVCPNFDDNLIGMACDDGDVCTTGETYDANCGCSGGTEIGDSDGDGVCDAEDVCPNFDDNLIGTACDDGDICTTGETYDANCGCSGGTPVGDSDGDGYCDTEDICPNFDDDLIGMACDDGDACTEGETYDANCGCSGGTEVGDSDSDGVCDAEDVCPNFDDNLIGTPCDDGDICTTGETYDANCGCSGGTPVGDSDGDGYCDTEDICPNFDDDLIGMACDDGNECTEGETYDSNCGCSGGVPVGDSDGDGVCDSEDICPNFDDNLIGTPCDDGDICTTGETYDSNCGCSGGVPVGDSDGDGYCDTEDICPNFDDDLIGMACDDGDACTEGETYDANCGCSGGTEVGDSDSDGVCDAEDVCPNFDDNLIGTPCDDGDICTTDETYDSNCGCSGGTPVGDSDGDGYCDTEDICPNFDDDLIGMACDDGNECTEGETYDSNCGCSGGVPVGDSDGDGVCDSEDICPNFDDNLIGTPCDDGDICTTGETYDANCGCSGGVPVGDSDGDGYCDTEDICPNFDDDLIGMACDDGDACTEGETYDANCGCSGGTEVGDSDSDGVCDTEDVCPNFDDNLIGTPCDDGDICTTGETYDANCGCSGGAPVGDSDGDGYCDTEDICPNFDDDLIGMACDDGDACTEGETYDANCGCSGGTEVGDSDSDGVCDTEDVCPNFDDNLIGTPCDDGDICTTGETYDANCGCSGGIPVGDSDGDGYCDTEDICPNFDDDLIGMACDDGDACTEGETYDANCGCSGGTEVGDSDGDGVCDAEDVCPNFDDNLIGTPCDDGDICTTGETYDANCGCSGGAPVGDSDGDGYCDTEDICPNFDDDLIGMACDDGDACTEGETYDANCGCSGGVPLDDTDGDGICDLIDECPDDPNNECNISYCDIIASTQYEYIEQVILESINNSSGDNGGYADFTALTTDVQKGQSYPITLVPGFVGAAYQEYWSIWIDLNNDGDFDDADEKVLELNSNATISDVVNIPTSGIDGETRMRISMKYNAYSEPCGDIIEGEAEDYTVNLLPVCIVGTACDDGDECTTGETFDSDCECTGGTEEEDCEGCPIINWTDSGVQSYDPGQDFGPFEIQESGTTLFMEGNAWKATEIGYNVTSNTVISFEFKSTSEGEIHEIGFDNDLIVAPDHRIVVYGDQGYSGTFSNPVYSGSGDWESFTISLGDNFTGYYQYLVLTADDDASSAGNSYYRNVTLFEDLDNNLMCDNSSDCSIVLTDNFELGYGNWNDGGTDCFLFSGNSNSGTNSVRIRDNSGSNSSVFTDPLDLSAYSSVQVSFSYLPLSMEANEDFFLEVSTNGGSSYTLIEEWNSGVEFTNGVRYFEEVSISGVTFTSNTIIRFRCDASGNADQVYLDDINIHGCELIGPALIQEDSEVRENESMEKLLPLSINLYPNPASYHINLTIENSILSDGKIEIRNTLNKLVMVKNVTVKKRNGEITISIKDLKTGAYFLTYLSGKDRITKRFIVSH